MRRVLGLLIAVAAAGPAAAQAPVPGGVGYFGASKLEPFNADAVFPKKPATPVIPPPVLPGDGTVSPDDIGPPLPGFAPPPKPKIWFGSIDVGTSGTTGNSETFNARTNWNVVRKSSDNVFTSDLLYTYSTQNGITTTQQALFNARDECLFAGTPWTVFTSSQVEYDELRAYRFRVGVYEGAGYLWVDDAKTTFRTRAGAGATRELGVGGPKDRWVPEMIYGYDYRCRFSDRSAFVSILDYYPRIADPAQFRVRARAALEYVIDPDTGTILRFGVQDRYDSDPGNARRNDLTYFMTLGIRF